MMPFFSTKEQVELLTSRLETSTYIFTLIAAVCGISFLFANRRLQQFSKAESDALQRRVVEINALSDAAKADAATARVQVEEMKTERVKLELQLKQVEEAHAKLATTNAQNEEKIVKLQEAKKPRQIVPAQSSQIANLLKPFAGQAVNVQLYGQDNETTQFSNQITAILKAAGLQVSVTMMMGMSGTGLAIVVNSDKNIPPLAGTIQHAFKAGGVDMDGMVRPELVSQGQFILAIGEKPQK
jgi:hypothetical protein